MSSTFRWREASSTPLGLNGLRTALLLLLLLALPALAGGKAGKVSEALSVLDQMVDGSMNVNQATNKLSFLGQERFATIQLLELLKRTSDPKKRAVMLEALSMLAIPDAEVERAFALALGDEDIANRLAALRGLGRIRAVTSASLIEKQLADKALGIRREAARALGLIGLPRSGAALMAAAKSEDDPEVRALMLVSVGRTGDKRQIAQLEGMLEGSSESARLAAAQALCLIGAPKGQAFAKKLTGSKDKYERLQGVMLFEGASAKAAGPVLTPLLADEHPPVRAAAARILYQGGDKSKLDWLVLESFKAAGEAKLPYEKELELLRLTDEDRKAVLRKAGLL